MDLSILTLDFETYYTDEYSLRRMTTIQYICDARFEATGAAARIDKVSLPYQDEIKTFGAKSRWIEGPDLPKLFARVDWSRTALMSHNIDFDGAILAWRYGITPALYIDTLGMSRAAAPHAGRASLDAVLQYLGAPEKGDALAAAKGYRLKDLKANPAYYETYKRYAERDCDGCFWIFEALAHYFSGVSSVSTFHKNEEFFMMDAVARMTLLPQLSANRAVLYEHFNDVRAKKEKLIDRMRNKGILDPDNPRSTFMSNELFANLLRALNVEPPTKISLATGKEAYAFSKQDKEFTDLLEHEDALVQAAVAARLGVKSTLEETRSQRFIDLSLTQWPVESDRTASPALLKGAEIIPARMPFPLKYSGAHTHRLSGAMSLNLQNLGRKSRLREALIAPPGHKIVSADASQIEARIVSWLAGCGLIVEAFRAKEDVYSTFATGVYGRDINKHDNPGERFVGKTGILGLGFSMGVKKFKETCRVQGRAQNLPPEMYVISDELAERTVKTYRSKFHEIPAYWKIQEKAIEYLAHRQSLELGVLYVDGPSQSIILPNGMRLWYINMRKIITTRPGELPREQWAFDYGKITKYTFGGKQTENCVQALARIITMNAATRIRKYGRIGSWRPRNLAGQIHDQLIYVAPDEYAKDLLALVVEEMSKALDWFSTLPLDAEGGIGNNLLEIK
jgi:DNA polymerase I-like protein with 3'-5' exonuclease and polymerase domains